MGSFFGKHREIVANNIDPEKRGRLMINIPDVLSEGPLWAEACVPLAGPTGQRMGVYMVPPIGAEVWVEFEGGDPDYPIWVGCRWGSPSNIPTSALEGLPMSPNIVIQSLKQHKIVISDLPGPTGGIILKSDGGATIKINDLGITIDNGKGATIELIGQSVDINKGEMRIT